MTKRQAVSILTAVTLTIAVAGGAVAMSRGGGAASGASDVASSSSDAGVSPSSTAPADLGVDTSSLTVSSTPSDAQSPSEPVSGDASPSEVLPGAGSPPPTNPDDPIGHFDDDGPVPPGLGFKAPPKPHHGGVGLNGASDLAVAPSCSHQCITKGVAYARGFGAELVVETELPVQLYITAVADPNNDGVFEQHHADWTPFGVTSHSWALDHLVPGATYYAMVAATDAHGHTAHAWGEFTTLSHRTMYVELGSSSVFGGPAGIDATTMRLGLDGTYLDVTPGQQGILLFPDRGRYADLDFWMMRWWDAKLCEAAVFDGAPPQGHYAEGCVAWNSAVANDIDLDVVPAGVTHWTQSSVSLTLQPPTGAGDALPPGFGDPYYFTFQQPITLYVSYS